MSRIGVKPIDLPDGVNCEIKGRLVTVKGPKGELAFEHPEGIAVAQENGQLVVIRQGDQRQMRAYHGLTRALVANMVNGVSVGFTRQLNLIGIGYTAEQKGESIMLNLGYSHPIFFEPPPGVKLEVSNRNTTLTVTGIDKQAVGQVAAKIRSLRKPEPYKGKGVRYSDEYVQRKAGKTVGGATVA